MITVSSSSGLKGWWVPQGEELKTGPQALRQALLCGHMPVIALENEGVAGGGQVVFGGESPAPDARRILGYVPALSAEDLGDPEFRRIHGVRYAYVQGAMANAIASEALVESISASGGIGFFGAAGLSPARVEEAIDRIQKNLRNKPYGFNLIHSPNEPDLEAAIVDLYLRKGVHRICAAAYLGLTLPLVKYRVSGIHRNAAGEIVTPNHVFAKVSRVEVAQKFLSPPPAAMLKTLVEQGFLSADQAEMAASLPVAEDLTAEADSGGHTDNRPAICLIPTMIALRDELQSQFKYRRIPRVGAAGGIATPLSACAAFAMGAAYILTGSINQACQESGSSDLVRGMLAHARQADMAMAPAADMFEMGVNVQVLKWGTMFPVRAKRLYEIYRRYDSLESLPPAERDFVERDLLRSSWQQEWTNTRNFFLQRDPRQVERADQDAKHKMALVFRSYLGRASRWANQGLDDRKVDFQIWCGPAMGAFNEWVRGSFLEKVENRRASLLCHNLLLGAAYMTRINGLRNQGVSLSAEVQRYSPLPTEELTRYLGA